MSRSAISELVALICDLPQTYLTLLFMAETAETSTNLEGWRLGVVIASLFFGSFLIALDTNIVNVAIPRISTDFHALDDVLWYGTAYLLTITAFQPIYGSIYKFFNTTVVYRLSILTFEGMLLVTAPL